ncbi:hypothetical protein HYW82_01840 [Candidatus Peregrinibacteria bacterium]|nr:hypothetical protein [Candidatus Peregrinibacteria bacterium]
MKKLLILLLPILLTACGSKNEDSRPQISDKTLEEITEAYKANQQIEAEAIAQNDASICNEIQDNNQKYSCRFNIIAKEANQKKDPSICKQIEEKVAIQQCEESIISE